VREVHQRRRGIVGLADLPELNRHGATWSETNLPPAASAGGRDLTRDRTYCLTVATYASTAALSARLRARPGTS
jgi:hypothetical protein